MDELLVRKAGDRFATNRLGAYAVGKVYLRAVELGITVYGPMMEGRYDLVLDDGRKLYRTQVKYAGSTPSACRGVVQVGLRKWRNGGRSVIPCYTRDEIDLLLVYVRRIDRVLWFGPEVFHGRPFLWIRVEPTRNNQVKGCLMAADYIW